MANAYKTDSDTPEIGWKLHLVLVAMISLAAMFFHPPAAMEHYIIATIAAIAMVAVSGFIAYYIVKKAGSTPWAWEYRRIYAAYAAIVVVYWLAIGLAEYVPMAWSWVKYTALTPMYLWFRASGYWGNTTVIVGTLATLAAIKLAYYLATAHYRAEIARLTAELNDNKSTAEARQTAQNDRRWQYGSKIADAIVALKHDRRGGDQAIGNVRRSLEGLLDEMYNGGVYPAALLHKAAEKYEADKAKSARRDNPPAPPPS